MLVIRPVKALLGFMGGHQVLEWKSFILTGDPLECRYYYPVYIREKKYIALKAQYLHCGIITFTEKRIWVLLSSLLMEKSGAHGL